MCWLKTHINLKLKISIKIGEKRDDRINLNEIENQREEETKT
jgi:hypothetical protein